MTAKRRRSGETAIPSLNGRFLAVPGENHMVLVFDATRNQPWATYYGHQAGVYRRVSGTIKALRSVKHHERLCARLVKEQGDMNITPLTRDPSAMEVTFPAMPGQEEFRHLGYDLIALVVRHLYHVCLCPPYRRFSEEARHVLELVPLPDKGVRAEVGQVRGRSCITRAGTRQEAIESDIRWEEE
jgi:hypothetical protein